MKKQHSAVIMAGCFLAGMLVSTPATQAVTDYIKAMPSKQAIYVDGQPVTLNAFTIGGSNYVTLRDAGRVVGFNVYWQPNDSTVQIETDKPYTGEAPSSASAVQSGSSVTAPLTTTAQTIDEIRQEIVARTNTVRVAHGVKALPTDPMLMKAAQVRAEEMAATGCYSHTRPDGSSRLTTTDCLYASENICRIWQNNLDYRGVGLAEQSVNGWTASSGHFQNMTENSRYAIGVGVAKGVDSFGEECWYCVQWFLRTGYTITWVDTPKIP